MAKISFRAKPETVINGENEESWLKIPVLKRAHCEMSAFRTHPKYGSYANSDLFPSMLKRIREEMFGQAEYLKLHAIPTGVSVEPGSLLFTISFDV